ncbi:MAG: CPBP family intramembrane metalloprotease [Gammaproteobacteria bacterium]|jgi:membrane protease YdiL (CAAX protease family)
MWHATAVVLGLFGLISLALIPSERFLDRRVSREACVLVNTAERWVVVVLVLVYVLGVEHREPGSIGLQWPSLGGLGEGVALGLVAIVLFPVVHGLTRKLGSGRFDEGLARILALPGWLRVLLVITAGVFEEIAFRGFPILRLSEAGLALWVSVAVPLAFFTLVHLRHWGAAHLVTVGFYGLLFSVAFIVLGNLNVTIIAHILLDGFGLVVVPVLMKRRTRESTA